MKKRTFIIPLILIVVFSAATLVMTLCSTAFITTAVMTFQGAETEFIDIYKSCRKVSDMAYKLDNNYSNAATLRAIYSVDMYSIYKSEGRADELEDDYIEKCIKYSEVMLNMPAEEFLEQREKFIASPLDSLMPNDAELRRDYDVLPDYVWALYINGDTQKAKTLTENYLHSISSIESSALMSDFQNFLTYVYNYPYNENDLEWYWQTEQYIFDCQSATGPKYNFNNVVDLSQYWNDIYTQEGM